ncbi:unnamed protein product [Parnassius apollo]|uniref:(apollo) hypothetical protein n=1 Tax=Parnassius apollo TaxID=110799 RepID=A0A8S3X709_PARAO|nr:unnamed protein product [Parnassius apollo]
MSSNPKPIKSSSEPSTSRVARRKRLNSSEVEEFLRDSDEDVYAGSDVDYLNYIADEGDASSESAGDEEEEENVEAVPEQRFDASSVQTPSSPPTDLQQPSRTASTTRWTTDSSSMRDISFTKTNELLVPPPDRPNQYVDLFLTDYYLQKIVDSTNRNAENIRNSTQFRRSRITNWKPLTIEELKIFIDLLYHTSTEKMKRLVDYWKSHRLYKSVLSEHMLRNRFQLILRCLHFVEEGDDPARMKKCKMIINTFNETMDRIYYPGRNLSLDKSMVLFRGRLIFRRYIKGKRHKYGIKLYILLEPNGTIIRVHVFASTMDETFGRGHTEKIVEKFNQNNLDFGHAVFMDNFYNSYSLATKLLDRNIYCTGTLNKKRKDNPSEVISKKTKKR